MVFPEIVDACQLYKESIWAGKSETDGLQGMANGVLKYVFSPID
jgi:hypothetical protein